MKPLTSLTRVTPGNSALMRAASSGAVWIAIEMIGSQTLSLMVFSLMARYVSPVDFGLIGILYSIVFFIRVVLFDNIATYVIRLVNPSDIEYSTLFWIMISIGLVISCAIYMLAGVIEHFHIRERQQSFIISAMSVMIFFSSLGRMHEAWLARNFMFRSLAIRALIGAFAGGIVGLALAIKGFGVLALVSQQIVASVSSLMLMWIITPWRPAAAFSRHVSRSLLAWLRITTPNAFLAAASQNFDVTLVTLFFGIETAGLYTLSKRVKTALQLVATTPINGVSVPSLASAHGDPVRLKRVFIKGLMVISASGFPIFAGAAAVAPELLTSAFGLKWLPASPIFLTLAIATIPAMVMNYYDALFIVLNRVRWSLLASTLVLALTVAGFWLSSGVKPTYAAVPFVVPYLIIWPIMSYGVSRLLDISAREFFAAMGPSLVSTAVMYMGVSFSRYLIILTLPVFNLISFIVVGTILYLGCMCCIGRNHISLMFSIAREMLSSKRI